MGRARPTQAHLSRLREKRVLPQRLAVDCAMIGMVSRIRLPTRRPEDWRRLLAEPVKHWRVGYSAYELAHAWQAASGFPPTVKKALSPTFGQLEFLFGFPEHKVAVPGRGGDSATDLFVLARAATSELVSIAVEGKVGESFDKLVNEWLDDPKGNRANRRDRLKGLVEIVGLDPARLANIPYQLLHRTAVALLEAQRYGAKHAVLMVHSFSATQEHHDEYKRFAKLFGALAAFGELEAVGQRNGVELYFCWIADQPRVQLHAGDPEQVLLEALAWLRLTYREHRFFKERDVEAALQQRMAELFEERRSSWCVIENYKTIDLAVVDRKAPGKIALGAEIKYEPDHNRPGEEARRKTGKLPVTEWPLIEKDRGKLRARVDEDTVDVGFAVLIDEGGYFRRMHNPPPFGEWHIWGEDKEKKMAPAMLVERLA